MKQSTSPSTTATQPLISDLRRLIDEARTAAADKGQMELYLRWLECYEREPTEEPPIGLLLCAEGSHEQIELLRLDESGIRVAEYLTELPSQQMFAENLLLRLPWRKPDWIGSRSRTVPVLSIRT